MVRVERLFARWYAFRTATSRPHNLKTLNLKTLKLNKLSTYET